LVEYDAASQWYKATLTVAAGWLKENGRVTYGAGSQTPDDIRAQLSRLGLNVEDLEKQEKLQLQDWFTATLGLKSKEKLAPPSLKVADLSIWTAKEQMQGPPAVDLLRIADNIPVLDRFNTEKSWIEYVLTRVIPSRRFRKTTAIRGVMRNIHSEWAYKQLEGAVDGIIDFKLDDTGDQLRNLIRIRNMRDVGFDGRWHALRMGENFEITLEK
jgi:KaiC/GvpD/RAD55 family RecA-like ATPase